MAKAAAGHARVEGVQPIKALEPALREQPIKARPFGVVVLRAKLAGSGLEQGARPNRNVGKYLEQLPIEGCEW
jgi:hypothetical protein